tara:strand:+ start:59 stop:922 length:864 start_codon:yes stop_codon:yes gene_type:complete
VTGHRGYIGSKVFAALKEAGHDVMGIDLKDGDDIIEKLRPNKSGEYNSKWSEFKPEYILHLAAFPRVVYSIEHPVEVIENNLLSTLYVLQFASHIGAKRVVYSSSSSVRGNGNGPESPYAASKYMPESMCNVWSFLYGVDTVCLRYFNVYSPCQVAGSAYATAIANFMEHIRQGKSPFITGDGSQTRDMSHVEDVVSANLFCMSQEKLFNGAFFDVGTGDNISLNEIKDIVLEYFPTVEFNYVEDRPGDVMHTKADISPLLELGWKPSNNIQQGIRNCFKLLKQSLQ